MKRRIRVAAASLLLALGGLGLNACGGGDDDEGTVTEATVSPETTTEATVPPTTTTEVQVQLPPKPSPELVRALRRAANDWASLFVTNSCNRYMGQPICERLECFDIENCTPVSAAFQRSFADATVEDIALKGIAVLGKPVAEPVYQAAVKFSNGEVVVFSAGAGVKHPEWGIGPSNHRFVQAAAPLE